jgi:hypothetical protein
MKSHLQFLSLNINGLRDDVRRRGIFCWLKQLSYDVILLQDIRYQDGDNFLWSQDWGMAALWSNHNAILLIYNQSRSSTCCGQAPFGEDSYGRPTGGHNCWISVCTC